MSLYLFVLTFAVKLKDAYYKCHWNILVFCDQWEMILDLNISHEKMADFVSFPFFGFTVFIKLRIFDSESHWTTLIFFNWKKQIMSDLIMSCQCLIWFKFCCLSRILAISWEIWILNFIEIV